MASSIPSIEDLISDEEDKLIRLTLNGTALALT
jgi:hypothetical protein